MTETTESVLPGPGEPTAPPVDPIVAFRNVSIAFDGPPVLQDISFSIGPRETRILLGPAGVGKSVLLKLINGLIRPDKGDILLFGEDISTMREEQLFPLRIRTGMVFQEGALFDSLTVRDNVAYQLIQERMPTKRSISEYTSTHFRRARSHVQFFSGRYFGRDAPTRGHCTRTDSPA